MKKTITIIVVLIIVGSVAWYIKNGSGANVTTESNPDTTTANSVSVNPASVVKDSDGLSVYRNEELGFSIKYPSIWNVETSATGITVAVPTGAVNDSNQNTINKLQISADVLSSACAFPQVTTISERDTIKVGNSVFKMIAMSNAVQGRTYFNRMYSTSQGNVCYMFSLASITTNPANKGYSATQLEAVNKANKTAIDSADLAFKALVKSFTFVSTPDGDNEALHPQAK